MSKIIKFKNMEGIWLVVDSFEFTTDYQTDKKKIGFAFVLIRENKKYFLISVLDDNYYFNLFEEDNEGSSWHGIIPLENKYKNIKKKTISMGIEIDER